MREGCWLSAARFLGRRLRNERKRLGRNDDFCWFLSIGVKSCDAAGNENRYSAAWAGCNAAASASALAFAAAISAAFFSTSSTR
jgi:hypothetical protein